MRIIGKLSLSLIFVGFMAFSFILGGVSKDSSKSTLSLRNLEALQASAGESYCDQRDESSCSISVTLPDGSTVIGKSKGWISSGAPGN